MCECWRPTPYRQPLDLPSCRPFQRFALQASNAPFAPPMALEGRAPAAGIYTKGAPAAHGLD
jgi:hypothetical protein